MTRDNHTALVHLIDRTIFKDASPGISDANRAAAFAQALKNMGSADFAFLEAAVAAEKSTRTG